MSTVYPERDGTRASSQQQRRVHVDSSPLPTDSMITVPLSESEKSVDIHDDKYEGPDITVDTDVARSRPSSIEILQGNGVARKGRGSVDFHAQNINRVSTMEMEETLDMIEEAEEGEGAGHEQRGRRRSAGSDGSGRVDWAELDGREEQEVKDLDISGDEQTALLLARLEQENQAIASNPKAGVKARLRKLTAGRPPSMADLQTLVQNNRRQSLRISRMPSPPPMTELDFWAALVKDYPSTAQRLPTLTSNKIRGGIPPPLRGVVWVSMAGARDKLLEEQYDRLCGEQSPYENIINKDIGRSFPGVEMFREADGEGQKMLGRVLKCFSLYDNKIGYCQGLGFLVGPLLMQMGERDAFCVLVRRLMEDYDLHSCFQPDLSGLHLRIYQFQELLHQHLPVLAAHLDHLQVEAAYLSQWFLSFFAVTCPLPMLFRIYDVIFAEGASETMMRVALSVMRRNEKRILGLQEFEDVMQLLLSRALWDPYGLSARSADELVNDFVSFTSLVTRENLRELVASFRAAQGGDSSARLGFFPEVQHTASRFLGRLWAPAGTPTKTASMLSPASLATPSTSSRPGSFLRKTPSKQSLASTHNSTEASSESTMSSSSSGTTLTDATTLSRVTSDEYPASVKSSKTQTESLMAIVKSTSSMSNQDRDLHTQIEDLLTALSEMQREHAQLAAQLAKEREEREEDCSVVRSLLDALAEEKRRSKRVSDQDLHGRRRTASPTRRPVSVCEKQKEEPETTGKKRMSNLIAKAEYRFPFTPGHQRHSASLETKSQLRNALTQAREHVASESSRAAELARQLEAKDQEANTIREQLRDARTRVQAEFGEKQRLEKTVQEMRQAQRNNNESTNQFAAAANTDNGSNRSRSNSGSSGKGLREFKLGRVNTAMTPPQFSKRSSSLATQAVLGSLATNVPPDREALLLELVNAKTAEAVARQELDEMRGKFESMRRLLGQQSPAISSNGGTPATTPGAGGGHKANASEGWVSFLSGGASKESSAASPPNSGNNEKAVAHAVEPEKVKASSTSSGGFWGWGKKTAG
ncbi:hypothetical protein NA57DRAFT_38643 [Rhizodiscina lignyota]|uniref:Rab-GAP TBC domain-containing protein n=1 Tax=Rhizodiscina lignyota TaxID=1504668 RepID=A0A9P4IID6_9PEZI|nr:hypothetical protein NA57DRAFT_38643 [Rhizodiscina lignyota]